MAQKRGGPPPLSGARLLSSLGVAMLWPLVDSSYFQVITEWEVRQIGVLILSLVVRLKHI